jgi:prepilin-type N-terminal cleavage/methylation domain-containing protein
VSASNLQETAKKSGFTLVELLVVISVTTILVTTFSAAALNYFDTISKTDASIEMTNDSQDLLRNTVNNIRIGDGVRQTNTITDPNAPTGGWNTGNTNFVIVIAIPAIDSSRNYIIDPSTGSPYMNELVYYKNGTALTERVLANPNASGNNIKTTCPANLVTTSCPADKVLANYVSSMIFTFYDQNNTLTTDPTQARSIKIDLSMTHPIFGTPLTLNNSIRVTLRNRF